MPPNLKASLKIKALVIIVVVIKQSQFIAKACTNASKKISTLDNS